MLSPLRQRKIARVLFDEAHGEAWSIRPEVAASMRPEHPAAASYAAAAAPLPSATSRSRRTRGGSLSGGVLAEADVLVIAHPSDAQWEGTVGGSPVLSAEEIAAVVRLRGRRRRPCGARRDRAGEVRRQPQRAAGALRRRHRERDRLRLRRPRRGAHLGGRRAGARRRRRRPSSTSSTRCASTAPAARCRADPAPALLRTRATAQPAGAALLAAVPHGDGRVAVARRLGPVRRRLPEPSRPPAAVAQPPLLGRRCPPFAPPLRRSPQRPRRTRPGGGCGTRPTRCACCRSPTGDVDLQRARPRRCARPCRGDDREPRRPGAALSPPEGVPGAGARRPQRLGRRRLRQAGLHGRRWPCSAPSSSAATASSTSSSSPCTRPTARADTRFEALIVRTPWPEFVAELEREEFDNGKFVPVQLVDYTGGYDSECAVLFPETVSLAGPADQQLRRRSSATASRRASGGPRPRARRPCASTCRPTPPRSSAPPTWRSRRTSCGTSSTTAGTATASCRSTRS